MAFKQFKARYAGSVLGFFWAVLNPLLITLVVSFVFGAVFKVAVKDFPLFVLSGMFPWMFFSGALSEASSSVLAQQSILRQFNVPRAVLPMANVLSGFLNFLVGWLVILPLFIFFNHGVAVLCFWLPFVFLATLIFLWGLGLLFSIVNVFVRDFGNLIGVLLMFWLWVTPVFYAPAMVPQKFQWVSAYNPMTPFIVLYRDILFYVRAPDPATLMGVFLWACASFILGLTVFFRLEPQLLKRL
jgi:lipopolysaccharide transport system permease protein